MFNIVTHYSFRNFQYLLNVRLKNSFQNILFYSPFLSLYIYTITTLENVSLESKLDCCSPPPPPSSPRIYLHFNNIINVLQYIFAHNRTCTSPRKVTMCFGTPEETCETSKLTCVKKIEIIMLCFFGHANPLCILQMFVLQCVHVFRVPNTC